VLVCQIWALADFDPFHSWQTGDTILIGRVNRRSWLPPLLWSSAVPDPLRALLRLRLRQKRHGLRRFNCFILPWQWSIASLIGQDDLFERLCVDRRRNLHRLCKVLVARLIMILGFSSVSGILWYLRPIAETTCLTCGRSPWLLERLEVGKLDGGHWRSCCRGVLLCVGSSCRFLPLKLDNLVLVDGVDVRRRRHLFF